MAQTVLLFANNARSTLSGSITAVATSATLATGTGVLFPNPNNAIGEYFKLTFTDQATGLLNEIVHVTAVVGDVVTIVRAQEGTTALAWNAGDFAVNMWTKNSANAMLQAPQVQNNTINSVTAGGTSDAITATYAPVYAAWVDGMTFFAKITAANTTTTPTISPNGLTAKTIVKGGGVALIAGDLQVGAIAEFKYSSTLDKVLLQNPATSGNGGQFTLLQLITTNLYIKPNASTPNTKLDITAQEAMLISGNNVIKPTSISCTLDITVNGLNGLDTGTRAANTWYTIYFISNGTTTGAIASLSTSSPTLPSGYTFSGFIGAFRTNGSSNIIHFTQRQNVVEFTETNVLTAGQASVSGTFQGLSIATAVPAQAKRAKCRLSSSIAGNGVLKVAANASGDGVAGGNISTANLYETVQVLITDQQLLYWTQNSNTAGAVCIINISGFEF
ncbi:MAG: hypothetical protein RL755_15 [Pseudomonadota bacterium]|jgi:hypothetical protein